ncbi:ABC transporter ATP-binding protein [Aureimonas jatrophae]|jgi:sn-glycerol 3-phosphate transport system ATP-binding protein|uniref:Carbohydrate ABC transporter ATP-binding protein, CUT1 family n=1 Tax=Aureimonas jatrophae TaxID=1166073 RepID=A0A1H0DCE9_9HYPH|nr:sn-glycerol-3-phosphate ABC transporter ATP-binding protein UgpC [Aureimonas jatrophae]MBB3951816.1 sn-glycerol 3-phosphate transport system ATP-binding protein [Aureimonas jatrophae]SDN67842.1 carbohydrate ABC transporter ATP-binding protein, CUT1 family [Aureimonas jatrophae]
MSAISIRRVAKSYAQSPVVHGVDLEIEEREFVVILGPSGCGKSTLLRMIAGLEDITSGEIAIGDRVVNRLEPRERGCAMVFQNYALYPHMTVGQNIGYALKVAGVPKPERQRRVEAVAATVGLAEMLQRKPAALSGGQRQRVAMARAMIREPRIFLFDEPLSNLDAILRVGMRAEIRRLHRRLGTTSVFVTHDQVEAMTMADKLVVMRAGRIEQVGSPAQVYNRPATRFVAGFIGTPPMNLLDGELEGGDSFRLADGQRVELAPGTRAGVGARAVTLGIRPEQAVLARPGTPGALRATVDVVEELGAQRIVYADLAGTMFAVAIPHDAAEVRAGEGIAVLLPAAQLHLFGREGGERIEPQRRTAGTPVAA